MNRVVNCFLVAGWFMLAGVAAAPAAELEHRTFTLSIDGTPIGEAKLSMQSLDDGSKNMASRWSIQTKHGSATTNLSYRGLESWNKDRLVRLEGHVELDGAKKHIVATAEEKRIRIRCNGKRTDAHVRAWTTSFWYLPDDSRRQQTIAVIDIATGEEHVGKLEYVGIRKLSAVGQTLDCTYFRFNASDYRADIWYDGTDRLMRLETTSAGKTTKWELAKVDK